MLFDGVCGLCNGVTRFVLERDPGGRFHFASLQSAPGRSALAPFGLNPDDLTTLYVLPDYRRASSTPLTKARAALFVIARLGWPWKAAELLGVMPNAMLDRLYDLVARHRYRVFGREDTCPMPPPEYAARFIDLKTDTSPGLKGVTP